MFGGWTTRRCPMSFCISFRLNLFTLRFFTWATNQPAQWKESFVKDTVSIVAEMGGEPARAVCAKWWKGGVVSVPKLNVKVISDPFSPKRFFETFLFLVFFLCLHEKFDHSKLMAICHYCGNWSLCHTSCTGAPNSQVNTHHIVRVFT